MTKLETPQFSVHKVYDDIHIIQNPKGETMGRIMYLQSAKLLEDAGMEESDLDEIDEGLEDYYEMHIITSERMDKGMKLTFRELRQIMDWIEKGDNE